MAQAFATILSNGKVSAFSAGSSPSGIINPKAIRTMKELDYDLSKHSSKSLEEIKQEAPFDVLVTMGCGDACPWMPAHKTVDWNIPDPKELNEEEFRSIRDMIREKVADLISHL